MCALYAGRRGRLSARVFPATFATRLRRLDPAPLPSADEPRPKNQEHEPACEDGLSTCAFDEALASTAGRYGLGRLPRPAAGRVGDQVRYGSGLGRSLRPATGRVGYELTGGRVAGSLDFRQLLRRGQPLEGRTGAAGRVGDEVGDRALLCRGLRSAARRVSDEVG